MVVRTDTLDGAQGPRAKASAIAVGHTQIHRHTQQCDVQTTEIVGVLSLRKAPCIQKCRNTGEGPLALVSASELGTGHFLKMRLKNITAGRIAILVAKGFQMRFVDRT